MALPGAPLAALRLHPGELPGALLLCGVGAAGRFYLRQWKAIPPRLTIDPSPWSSAKRPFTSAISPARLQRHSSAAQDGRQSPPLH